MAKWILGILDGRRWGVDGVTTVCGQDWTGLNGIEIFHKLFTPEMVPDALAIRDSGTVLGMRLYSHCCSIPICSTLFTHSCNTVADTHHHR